MDGLVLKALHHEASLRPSSRLVLTVLADLADEESRVEITMRGLAERSGMSLNGLTKAVSELVATGCVRKLNPGSGRRPITYQLNL